MFFLSHQKFTDVMTACSYSQDDSFINVTSKYEGRYKITQIITEQKIFFYGKISTLFNSLKLDLVLC